MLILLIFSFLAGIVTVLSPCILPVLPIVLSSSFGRGKSRPFGIVVGFVLSFTIFTLFLTAIVRVLGIPAESLRYFSIILVFLFGLSLLFDKVQQILEKLFAKLSRFVPRTESKEGFSGGVVVGFTIGLLWTPCVGPILGSVISLALTGSVSLTSFLITLSYSLGTSIPMFILIYGGQNILNKVPNLVKNSSKIQKIFGILMIITAIAIYFNIDRQFQNYIIQKFPGYGTGLTKIEDNKAVKDQLNKLNSDGSPSNSSANQGKPSFLMTDDASLAPELIPGGGFINLPIGKQNLTITELRGKVVLVDFWTYTCINCIRTLPYIKSWDDKYRDKGLVIIGIHTPEFEFEKDYKNVAKAVKDFGIKYPIMQDNNYATWTAYKNHYWPAKYLIDKEGKIRYTHFGEGNYDKTESAIQELLKEAGADVSGMPVQNEDYSIQAKTAETYLGYARIQNFASPEPISKDSLFVYSKPNYLSGDNFAYENEWMVGSEYATPSKGAKLYLNFSAKQVFLVMRPKLGSVRVKVVLNGAVPDENNKGEDVKDGIVKVDSDRLYKLINLKNPGRNTLILEFVDGNVELFAFTFG